MGIHFYENILSEINLPLRICVLSRDREKGECKRFNPTQNRNLNFPASYKSGDLSLTFLASPPLDVSAGATALGLGRPFALEAGKSRIQIFV